MKKLFLVLAFTAIYAISNSSIQAVNTVFKHSENTVFTQLEQEDATPEGEDEKEKDKKKKTVKKSSKCCPGKTAIKTGCSEAQKKSCAASKVKCGETKKDKKENKK